MNFDLIKVRVIELVVIIFRSAIEAGVDSKELLGLNYSYLTELNQIENFEDLCHKVAEILDNFISKVAKTKIKKTKKEVQMMINYINQHFTEKISIPNIAFVAGLSISRAVHLFKEETGYTITHYIKRIRVEYSKYLLKNTDNIAPVDFSQIDQEWQDTYNSQVIATLSPLSFLIFHSVLYIPLLYNFLGYFFTRSPLIL